MSRKAKNKESNKEKGKPVKAQDIIDRIKLDSLELPPDEALVQLGILLKHNDALPRRSNYYRVSQARACELLAAYGYTCGVKGLDKLCRTLGRKSYAHA